MGQHKENPNAGTHVYYMRSHPNRDVKVAVLAKSEHIPFHLTEDQIKKEELHQIIQAKAEEKNKALPNYFPVYGVAALSSRGTPSKVFISPTKRRTFSKEADIGCFSFFTDQSDEPLEEKMVTEIAADHPFFHSPSYAAVKPIRGNAKHQAATITSESLKAARKENAEASSRSQNRVMANKGFHEKDASATKYIQASGLFSSEREANWYHLIQNDSIGIERSMVPENLVAASKEANTFQILAGSQHRRLVKQYPSIVDEVTSGTIENTHIATTITEQIKTPSYSLNFKINGQTVQNPYTIYLPVTNNIVSSMTETCQAVSSGKPLPSLSQSNPQTFLFFTKNNSSAKDENALQTITDQSVEKVTVTKPS